MNWFSSFSKHLYLLIWLAVVVGVAVLMLVVGWAWSLSVEHVAHNGPQGMRELQVRNEQGELLTAVPGQMQRGVGVNFELILPDGQKLKLDRAIHIMANYLAQGLALAWVLADSIVAWAWGLATCPLGGPVHLMDLFGCCCWLDWPWPSVSTPSFAN